MLEPSASDPEHADPAAAPSGRDCLAGSCFWLHVAVMIYIVIGWLVPVHAALVFYLVFLPTMATQWWFNRNSCVLNNLESLMRHGRWRDSRNVEEGAWLRHLVGRVLGLKIRPLHMEMFTYCALALFWALGAWRLIRS
ncbi:MAG TPA: hypothetical protein VGF97_02365 [Rhizomicrobium sp.]|jgi:hypothetical protein